MESVRVRNNGYECMLEIIKKRGNKFIMFYSSAIKITDVSDLYRPTVRRICIILHVIIFTIILV